MTIREAYKLARRAYPKLNASAALAIARAILSGERKAPSVEESGIGVPFQIGRESVRFVEVPHLSGLRLVGYADEVRPRLIEHKGWFLHDECHTGEVARGVVYQLPAKRGVPRFLAAVADPFQSDAAMVRFEVIADDADRRSGVERARDLDGAREAAREADHMAEVFAESERDYHRAWDAGQRFAQLGEDLREARRQFLDVRREAREAARGVQPGATLCAALASHLDTLLETIREAREERATLKSGDHGRYWFSPRDASQLSAFNDGAQSC